MIQQKSIIKKYVIALYKIAVKLQQVGEVERNLLSIEAKLNDNKHYKKLMISQLAPYKMKQIFINTALTDIEVTEITRNFIAVLIANNRIYLLSDIIEYFHDVVLENNGVLKAEITVCHDDDLAENIHHQLKRISGKKVLLETIKDNNILGGFILKVNNKVLDCSLKNRINKLRKILG